jgi:hypothetical protein
VNNRPERRFSRIVDTLIDTSDAWIGAVALLAILGIVGLLCCFGVRIVSLVDL